MDCSLRGMREAKLYEELLQVKSPWYVERVELSIEQKRVDVYIDHKPGSLLPCPNCGAGSGVYDHTARRSFRHLDTMQYQTILHCQMPRVQCSEHGVVQVSIPWAEAKSRFTRHFETLAIDVLKGMSIKAACGILRVSWDEAYAIKKRAVLRGLARRPVESFRRLGVDEVAFRKGHSYMTIVTDLVGKKVLYVGRHRKKETLDAFWQALSAEQREAIEAVGMDMWEPYVSSTLEHMPRAEEKIVFDRFHIMKHMNDALNDVRKAEHRALKTLGDERLKGTRNAWLYAQENVPEKYDELLEDLVNSELKTARAWALKELLRNLWAYESKGWARKLWSRWYAWAVRSRLEPVKKVARMIKQRLGQVMNFFTHRITNAMCEGMNLLIQNVKRQAFGYRNEENLKHAILFQCGRLDLYPRPTE